MSEKTKTIKKRSKGRVIASSILGSLSAIIFVLAAYILSSVLVARAKGSLPTIFGYSFHLVVTESMTGTEEEGGINKNDLVIAKKTAYSDIKINDDIIFFNTSEGLPIVHRVYRIDGGNIRTYHLYDIAGSKTLIFDDQQIYGYKDSFVVTENVYMGTVTKVSPKAGAIIAPFMKDIGQSLLFVIVGIVMLVIIVSQIINIVKTIKKKQEEEIIEESEIDIKQQLKQQLIEELKEQYGQDIFSKKIDETESPVMPKNKPDKMPPKSEAPPFQKNEHKEEVQEKENFTPNAAKNSKKD